MLSAPAPNATIWSSPPAIITFLRKWIIWFWSAGSGDFDGRGAVARAMSLPSAARSARVPSDVAPVGRAAVQRVVGGVEIENDLLGRPLSPEDASANSNTTRDGTGGALNSPLPRVA